jgi:gas vesicle protein
MSNKEIPFFFTGFVAGALVGVTAALLLAPQSGKETRAQIREKGIELEGKAHEAYDQAKARVETTSEQIRHKADETVAKMEGAFAHAKNERADEFEQTAT